jgi:hypothetical protein
MFKSICRPEFSTKTDNEVHNPSSVDQENTYKLVLACLGLFEKVEKNGFDRKTGLIEYT